MRRSVKNAVAYCTAGQTIELADSNDTQEHEPLIDTKMTKHEIRLNPTQHFKSKSI